MGEPLTIEAVRDELRREIDELRREIAQLKHGDGAAGAQQTRWDLLAVGMEEARQLREKSQRLREAARGDGTGGTPPPQIVVPPVTPAEREHRLASVAVLRRLQEAILRERGGELMPSSGDEIARMREERGEEVLRRAEGRS